MLDRLNRHDLSDEEWQRLRPLLPADPPRGGRRAAHRMVINGILFRTRAGCPWRGLPDAFGDRTTRHHPPPRRAPGRARAARLPGPREKRRPPPAAGAAAASDPPRAPTPAGGGGPPGNPVVTREQERQKKPPRYPRPGGGPPAGLRPGLVQETQHRRALLQQAQAV